jgi:FtsP/CotA-like multicopper oxidase with cupredoxin domain
MTPDGLPPNPARDAQKLPGPWIWWDVISIPAGVQLTEAGTGNPVLDAQGKPAVVPGYIRMRSRFVDYIGKYVLHCHILGHEDRGMMQMVQVVNNKTVVTHH